MQGNQALLIIRQVLALVELWELELPSVFHFFTGIIILSPTQLLSRLITKRFNQHISEWNLLLIDFRWKHFCVTFFSSGIFVQNCFCLIMGWLDLQVCINFAGPIWNRTVQDGHYLTNGASIFSIQHQF